MLAITLLDCYQSCPHATRLIPLDLHIAVTVIPIRTNSLTAAMFSVSYFNCVLQHQGHTQSLAGPHGFEPRLPESKSGVLPLDEEPIKRKW